MQPQAQDQVLLRVEELAQLLHKSIASIRSDISRNPHALPPLCRLPGTKRLLWREEDVSRWLADHVISEVPPASSRAARAASSIRRRGRPTKAEQLRRQLGVAENG
jgi:predicted DNA-binding transcriptional regulator AlpA